MAFGFEKPLRDFLQNFQKDLNLLQKKLKQESDILVGKAKTAAQKNNLQAKRHEVEKIVEKNLKKVEPKINKLVQDLNKTAKRAGVDLTELETKVRDNLSTARGKLAKKGEATKTATKTKKAPAKKAAGRKASAKKASTGTKRGVNGAARTDTSGATAAAPVAAAAPEHTNAAATAAE